jgi:hypothetical protein
VMVSALSLTKSRVNVTPRQMVTALTNAGRSSTAMVTCLSLIVLSFLSLDAQAGQR